MCHRIELKNTGNHIILKVCIRLTTMKKSLQMLILQMLIAVTAKVKMENNSISITNVPHGIIHCISPLIKVGQCERLKRFVEDLNVSFTTRH